jgi:hypothetical protein
MTVSPAITKLVESAKAKANQALQTQSQYERKQFAAQYNELLEQIEDTARDSSYKGKKLLAGAGNDLRTSSTKIQHLAWISPQLITPTPLSLLVSTCRIWWKDRAELLRSICLAEPRQPSPSPVLMVR